MVDAKQAGVGDGGWWRLARVLLALGLAVTALLCAIFLLARCAGGGV